MLDFLEKLAQNATLWCSMRGFWLLFLLPWLLVLGLAIWLLVGAL